MIILDLQIAVVLLHILTLIFVYKIDNLTSMKRNSPLLNSELLKLIFDNFIHLQ